MLAKAENRKQYAQNISMFAIFPRFGNLILNCIDKTFGYLKKVAEAHPMHPCSLQTVRRALCTTSREVPCLSTRTPGQSITVLLLLFF